MIRNVCISLAVIIQLAVISVIYNKPIVYDNSNTETEIASVEADLDDKLAESNDSTVKEMTLVSAKEQTVGDTNESTETVEENNTVNDDEVKEQTSENDDDTTEILDESDTSRESAEYTLTMGDYVVILPNTCYYEAMLRFNIRKEPDINAQIIGKIPSGSNIYVIKTANDEWCEIDFDGLTGFCNTDIIRQCCTFNDKN